MHSPISNVTFGVMGSGSDEHPDLAEPIGELIAALDCNLLTGAGRGVMKAVSRAYARCRRARGICIGIVPCADMDRRDSPADGYPNEFVELPIFTHLPFSGGQGEHDLSRNHINILSSDAIVALPGGDGTASEVNLAVRYKAPIVAFGQNAAALANLHRDVPRVYRLDDVEAFLRRHLA